MLIFKIFFLLLLSSSIYAKPLIITDRIEQYDLLSHAQIFIDKSRNLNLSDIKKRENEFITNNENLLGYGYSPDFDVWIKFSLKNSTKKHINKILEYDNSLTTEISFFDPNDNYSIIKDGLFNISKNRKTINPTFTISLNPNETKIYYLKTSSYITPLIIKLNIINEKEFYAKEMKHQFYLALFFGAMVILALYNIFIYFFTKDISYLFYVLYIIGIIAHQLIYVGIGSIYVFNQTWVITIINFATVLVSFPSYALALFSKTFLKTKQYPIFDKILNFYLISVPLSLVLFTYTDLFPSLRNVFYISLTIFLFLLTIYATYKKNRQAYFIVLGWMVLLMAWLAMYFSSIGIFNIFKYFPYIVEVALVLEAIIFSIALADRINQLQKDKHDANQSLIKQQLNEKQRLKTKVSEKTKDLETALDEKGLLLKELNHRVKNNMQMIISLIRLQSNEIKDEKLQNIFLTAQNRINAMSQLHELLYKQESLTHINAYDYFTILIEELKDSYDNDIHIIYDIQTQLKMEQAIYCGLILNELVSNSFKYAFENEKGAINISLAKKDMSYELLVSDNGIGYDKTKSSNSLGLILVDTLAKKQLRGNLEFESTNGVSVKITWRNYD